MKGSTHRPRWAAIDVGSNSVLLTLAEQTIPGEFRVLSQSVTVTRLGQGVDLQARLHPEAETRTLACLQKYKEEMTRHGVLKGRAVGTSALRDALNSKAFLDRAKKILGFEIEVISGKQEAELSFQGALHGLKISGLVFVFDIGGGSTELILGDSQEGIITASESLDLGCVRLSERAKFSDPPTKEEVQALRGEIREALSNSRVKVPPETQTLGVAGTATTLAAIHQEMKSYDPQAIHGAFLPRKAVEKMVLELSGMTLSQRNAIPGLSPGRADVIVAGAILCEELLHHMRISSLRVSDRGLRFALLRALAQDVP